MDVFLLLFLLHSNYSLISTYILSSIMIVCSVLTAWICAISWPWRMQDLLWGEYYILTLCHSISYHYISYDMLLSLFFLFPLLRLFFCLSYCPHSFYLITSSSHPSFLPSLALFHSHGCRLVCELCLSYGEITKISDDVAAEHLSLAGFSRYMKSRK